MKIKLGIMFQDQEKLTRQSSALEVLCSRVADAPVYTAAGTVTFQPGASMLARYVERRGSSLPEKSEATLEGSQSPPDFFSTLRNMDYANCMREKDVEIARLKSLVEEKETESAEVPRLRDQFLRTLTSPFFDSPPLRTLCSTLDVSARCCTEAKNLISTLTSERDGLASEVSTLHSAFRDFKEKMEAQQEAQAQVLYNRVAELEAHVMDVLACYDESFEVSPSYNGILGSCFRPGPWNFVCKRVLEAGLMSNGVPEPPFPRSTTYNPEMLRPNFLRRANLLGEASTSAAALSVEDLDTDEDLGSMVCMPQFEDPRFEILP
ncbi:hypothetical protein Tco_1522236 [Tanacetum coccineum]